MSATNSSLQREGPRVVPLSSDATVGDVMHAGLVSCDADATIADVATVMALYRIHLRRHPGELT